MVTHATCAMHESCIYAAAILRVESKVQEGATHVACHLKGRGN